MKDMVTSGYFIIGEEFIHKNGKTAILADDSGKLTYNGHTSSMHEIAGEMEDKNIQVNGFDAFSVRRNGNLVSTADVRKEYRNKEIQ